MSRRDASREINVESLLESGKVLPRQPEAVRARALARARTTAAAPLPLMLAPAPRPHVPRYLMVPAAAAALAVGIVGTVFALGGLGSRPGPSPAAPSATVGSPAAAAPVASPSSVVSPPVVAEAVPAAAPVTESPAGSHVKRAASGAPRQEAGQESYRLELELMRSAHTAYAAHDFTNALLLVGEHSRRFPAGLLTEEREALRVRCLVGAGRLSEARRSAAAFATRFPRSVLLKRIQAEAGIE